MTSARTGLVLCLSVFFVFTAAISSAAPQASTDPQSPGASAPNPTSTQEPQEEEEDDAILQPAEPEYRLINLPTTMLLPKYKMSFDLTHRFEGNLAVGTFLDNLKTLFGIDQGSPAGQPWSRPESAESTSPARQSGCQRPLPPGPAASRRNRPALTG